MKSFTATDALAEFTATTILERETLDRTSVKEQFERILAEHGPALSRLAGSYTNTHSDRDDLLQETAFAIWQALPKFRGECSERTFIFRIAHNRAIAYLSRYRNEKVEALEDFDVHDPAPGPDSDYSQRQRIHNLRRSVRALPIPYRQVVLLTLEGLGYREIAAVLGISEGNVGARLTRARQLLQDAMEKQK
ncbi:MAG TPA: sigma-70 family RNA polymerase sigma factor [Candidatus Sulfotelmatobacter sp.]|nr:sigma-70 family RNA polymerase sigma factor [Candidatus Sulfotelmatobacter sp.]